MKNNEKLEDNSNEEFSETKEFLRVVKNDQNKNPQFDAYLKQFPFLTDTRPIEEEIVIFSGDSVKTKEHDSLKISEQVKLLLDCQNIQSNNNFTLDIINKTIDSVNEEYPLLRESIEAISDSVITSVLLSINDVLRVFPIDVNDAEKDGVSPVQRLKYNGILITFLWDKEISCFFSKAIKEVKNKVIMFDHVQKRFRMDFLSVVVEEQQKYYIEKLDEDFKTVRKMKEQFSSSPRREKDDSKKETEEKKIQFDFISPYRIKNHLDKYIIGQEQAKISLSVAFSNHFKHILSLDPADKENNEKIQSNTFLNVAYPRSNVLLVGPTGSGKTYMVKKAAEYMKVPYVIADATSFSPTGFKGEESINIFVRLIHAAKGDIALASRGIVFIDEFDKIGTSSMVDSNLKQVYTVMQYELLKYIEGSMVEVPVYNSYSYKNTEMKGKNTVSMDTTNILFVFGGAFTGLSSVIANRRKICEKSMGFMGNIKSIDEQRNETELLNMIEPEDIIEYGFVRELIGRISKIISLSKLDEKNLVEILAKSCESPTKQYHNLCKLYKKDLKFTDDAIRLIAKEANKKDIGARSLNMVCHDVMEKLMFHIDSISSDKILVDENDVSSAFTKKAEDTKTTTEENNSDNNNLEL